jgi:hypothetical protein
MMQRKSEFLLLGIMTMTSVNCREDRPYSVVASGRTVIPGTFSWEVKTGVMCRQGDFWWEHVSETERYLAPQNGAMAAVAAGVNFDDIDAGFIRQQRLSKDKISGADAGGILAPGVIVVFKTATGAYGKLRVERFRALHDLSFPEATVYEPSWRTLALERPNNLRYHLEVAWVLYE